MSINHAEQEGTREFAPENIPEELRRRRQWVNRDARKIPQTPGTKRRADSTDSETWRSFEEAVADGRGLGFVFTSGDPYTGVDLDKCRVPETGAIEPWARRVVEDLDGYVEVSPSGTGLHIIVRGKLPVGNNRRGQVESYKTSALLLSLFTLLPGRFLAVEKRPWWPLSPRIGHQIRWLWDVSSPISGRNQLDAGFFNRLTPPYSITYVNRPAGHFLPGRIETRKGHKDARNRARAPEIEPVKATQS